MVVYESCNRFDHDFSICTFNYGKYQWVVVVASIIVPRACGFGQSTDLFRYLLAYTLGMYFAQHDLLARIKEKFMEQNVAGKLLSLIVSLIGLAVIIKCRQNAWIGWKYLDFWDGFAAMYVIVNSYIYIIKWKMDRKRIRLPWKTFYEYFLDSFILQRRIFP